MYDLPKNMCCACESSVHLDVPSIGFVCVCNVIGFLGHNCLLSSCCFFL